MKVLSNNCVSEIKVPSKVDESYGVDYNPVLDLYATLDVEEGVFVWDPVSGQVVAEFEKECEGVSDMLFLPGNRVGVSEAEGNHGGSIRIFPLGEKSNSGVFEIEDLPMTYPGGLALSPDRNLLAADLFNSGDGVFEICMDWDDLKVLKSRNVLPGNVDAESGIPLLCCSKDFEISTVVDYPNILSSAKVFFNSEGEVKIEDQVTISHYMLEGEEREIGEEVTGLAHDGKNLIIATEDEIVLLESVTEGSNAHLIASDVKPSGQMRLNHKCQLMVCEGDVIKVFEYDCNPRCLQDICRCHVRETLHTGFTIKVNSLPIPSMLKGYLLYQ